MIRKKRLNLVINNNMINTALKLYKLFVSYMAALYLFLYLKFIKPNYTEAGRFNGPLIVYSFVIALQIQNIITEVIRSGTATYFITLVSKPKVFQLSCHERFNKIFCTYPQVPKKSKTTQYIKITLIVLK